MATGKRPFENPTSVTGLRSDMSGRRSVQSISFSASESLGIRFDGNAVIHVKPNGNAAKKGVKPGWRMVKINGQATGATTAEIKVCCSAAVPRATGK
eukprot:770851-Amorphochlora_amoeboformis.AAC.1